MDSNGRMGQITSNSWLDADYGKYLQQYLLENYKIEAIIESKSERFFDDADVNTCITLLKKCNSKQERESHNVKFVQLRDQLPNILSHLMEEDDSYTDWDDSLRWEATDKLLEWINEQEKYVLDNELGIRVYPISQKSLHEVGLDEETGRYKGAKWGRYTRAPDVFFENILNRSDNVLTQVTNIASVSEGQPTGSNSFFYLDEDQIEKWALEDRYLKPSLKSPKDSDRIRFARNELKKWKLVIDEGEEISNNLSEYLTWGKKEGHKKHYFSDPWYSKKSKVVPLAVGRGIWRQHITFYNRYENVVASDRFSEIDLNNTEGADDKVVCAFLNSTVGNLIIELSGRTNLGMGALDVQPTDIRKIPVLNPDELDEETQSELISRLKKMWDTEVSDVYDELGTEDPDEFSIENVADERQELDKIVFEILDISNTQQQEVYSALIDLVRTRQEKAETGTSSDDSGLSVDKEEIVKIALRSLDPAIIESATEWDFSELNTEEVKIEEDGEGEVEVDLSGTPKLVISGTELETDSVDEARFLRFQTIIRPDKILVPTDEHILEEVVSDFRKLNEEISTITENVLELTINDENTRGDLKNEVITDIWRRVFELEEDEFLALES